MFCSDQTHLLSIKLIRMTLNQNEREDDAVGLSESKYGWFDSRFDLLTEGQRMIKAELRLCNVSLSTSGRSMSILLPDPVLGVPLALL